MLPNVRRTHGRTYVAETPQGIYIIRHHGGNDWTVQTPSGSRVPTSSLDWARDYVHVHSTGGERCEATEYVGAFERPEGYHGATAVVHICRSPGEGTLYEVYPYGYFPAGMYVPSSYIPV